MQPLQRNFRDELQQHPSAAYPPWHCLHFASSSRACTARRCIPSCTGLASPAELGWHVVECRLTCTGHVRILSRRVPSWPLGARGAALGPACMGGWHRAQCGLAGGQAQAHRSAHVAGQGQQRRFSPDLSSACAHHTSTCHGNASCGTTQTCSTSACATIALPPCYTPWQRMSSPTAPRGGGWSILYSTAGCHSPCWMGHFA